MGTFELIGIFIIVSCFCAVLFSVAVDFVKFGSNNMAKREKKSIVATGTMLFFFVIFYILIRSGIGSLEIKNLYLRVILILIGLIIIIFGSAINIWGRFNLGKNWANHIKIYHNHTLVGKGAYKLVRHPLYASLIWAFYGACLVYLNYYAFLANTLIFVPFMYYRAKQEEELLEKEFIDYNKYKQRVGMFFPKLFKKHDKI